MNVQMRTIVFKQLSRISVLSILERLNNACNKNNIYACAVVHLLRYFIKEPANEALPQRMTAGNMKNHQQEDQLTTNG